MTNSMLSSIITILILILVSFTNASGNIEMIIISPKTVLLEQTVCVTFECPEPDERTEPRKVQAGTALRIATTGQYDGEARERIDVHLKIIEPTTNEIIAIDHHRPLANTEWTPIVVTTLRGFNVTVQLRNTCDRFYHGKRCGRYCVPSRERHWECSPEGERLCLPGWDGADCSNRMYPTSCPGNCNGRGKCVGINQCSCSDGFNGTTCEQCIPRAGCVNGRCHNDMPNTCKCHKGFVGDRCDIDINICSVQKPCENGGQCSMDPKSATGYKCECPFDFIGPQCKTPLSKVRCAASAGSVCQNEGACISMDERTIQCKCRDGFSGKFCEIGTHKDCSTLKCSETATCQMKVDAPSCVENETTTRIPVRTTTERAKAVEEGKTASTKNEEHRDAEKDFQSQFQALILFFLCIVGLVFSVLVIYIRYIHPRLSSSARPLPTTSTSSPTSSKPSKHSKPPVYKVCIIDTENGTSSSHSSHLSDSEPDHCPHRHSPPPAYSSPVMSRVYKSLPMDDEATSSFRISNNTKS